MEDKEPGGKSVALGEQCYEAERELGYDTSWYWWLKKKSQEQDIVGLDAAYEG